MAMMLMVLMVLMNIVEERKGPCHQCRHEKRGVAGRCVNMISATRRCSLKYCPRCLLNRYRQDAEEVESNNDWVCFRCRGICNCGPCRRRVGLEPTGKFPNEAKENGCSSKRKEEVNDIDTVCEDENLAGEGSSSNLGRIKPVLEEKEIEEVKLPQCIESVTIFGVELPPRDVGSVLQFLEFSSAFAKGLNLSERQAESVIRETFAGRSNRSPRHSTLTQTMIQLLTVIREDRGKTLDCMHASDDSWFVALGECLADSGVKLDDFSPEMFQEGIVAYENLDASKRISLLNLLCSETLGTKLVRNIIGKKAKERVNDAKEKNKQVEKKLEDEVAKAEAEATKNGVPFTIDDRLAIVSSMSEESQNACLELQDAVEIKKGRRSDPTIRTSPVVELDEDGLIIWKLNSYTEEPNYLLQGSCSEPSPHGKWFSFTSEQKPEIEKYIAFKKMKKAREIEANANIKMEEDDSP